MRDVVEVPVGWELPVRLLVLVLLCWVRLDGVAVLVVLPPLLPPPLPVPPLPRGLVFPLLPSDSGLELRRSSFRA